VIFGRVPRTPHATSHKENNCFILVIRQLSKTWLDTTVTASLTTFKEMRWRSHVSSSGMPCSKLYGLYKPLGCRGFSECCLCERSVAHELCYYQSQALPLPPVCPDDICLLQRSSLHIATKHFCNLQNTIWFLSTKLRPTVFVTCRFPWNSVSACTAV